jgi:hypothetical protein
MKVLHAKRKKVLADLTLLFLIVWKYTRELAGTV